jgi:hypothetical protein
MDGEHLVALLGNGWDVQQARSVVTEDMPPPVRRAQPTRYRLARTHRSRGDLALGPGSDVDRDACLPPRSGSVGYVRELSYL